MASIQDLKRRVRNVQSRLSSIFFLDKVASAGGTDTFIHAGQIQGGSISGESISSEPDQDGRTITQFVDLTISFVMQQATNKELSMLSDLVIPADSEYDNGHSIYVSGGKVSLDEVANIYQDPTQDPEGIFFENVLPSISPSLDLSGDDGSNIEIEIMGRVKPSQFDSLDTDKTITISAG